MKINLLAIPAALALAFLAVTPASAATFTFQTILSNAGEPVPTSTATGSTLVSFDNVANSVTVLMSFSGLANSAPFAHIHCCTAVAGTGSAPVVLNFTSFPALATGSYINTFTLAPAAFNTLLTGASLGQAYVNIHTPGTYAGGEIRGFLPAVPEPGTYGLMAAGLAVVGLFAQRRRGGRANG